jgi:hypothetical protein|tara:strand:- start:1786 stop:1983 length:198 start_codon:yes stop_codon:yes gene_type:complete
MRQIPKYTIYKKLEDFKLPFLIKQFQEEEKKEFDYKGNISQCKTMMGLYIYGQIRLIQQILDKEI